MQQELEPIMVMDQASQVNGARFNMIIKMKMGMI